MQLKHLVAVLIPPSGGGMECIDSLADKVWVLGSQFGGIEAGNNADECKITLDVVAPMVLAQAEAKDVVKLGFGWGGSWT